MSAPREELHQLYVTHYDALVRSAYFVVRDVGVAEEIVQEAFISLHRDWTRLREPGRADAYLRATVLNRCHSRLRHAKVVARHSKPVEEPREHSAEQRALALIVREEVFEAVRCLPRRQREVLILRYYLELSEAEIAATLNISPGAVKSHAHRAAKALRLSLEAVK